MPTKSTPYYFDDSYVYLADSGGGIFSRFDVGSRVLLGTNAVTTDISLPGWRDLIRTGQNATTNLSGTEFQKRCAPCSLEYKAFVKNLPSQYWKYIIRGNMLAYHLSAASTNLGPATGYLDIADSRARTTFYQRLSEAQTQFKGAVFTGELRESLEMIRNPARSLRKGIGDYLDHLKKGGPRRAPRDRPKFVRDTWLEYSFGWKPLISDLEDATVAFLSSKWTRPIFKMVRARAENGTQPVRSAETILDAGTPGFKIRFFVESSARAQVKYYGIYRSSGSGPSTFRYYGFSPWEFVPTLWELIPYSFLVDYFTNIGDLVSAWSYRNIGIEWASRGHKLYNLREIKSARLSFEGNTSLYDVQVTSSECGSSATEYSQKQRLRTVTIPLPDFRFQVPGMGTKWVNMLALTKQLEETRRSLKP